MAREYPVTYRDIHLSICLKDCFDTKFILWKRKEEAKEETTNFETYVFSKNLRNLRDLRFIYYVFQFIQFTIEIIKKERPDILIVSHYSLYIPFFLITRFNSRVRKTEVIIDVHDLPSTESILIFNTLLWIEKLILPKNQKIILASRYYEDFYTNKKTLVLDNFPQDSKTNYRTSNKSTNVLKIAFVGAIRYFSLYKILIEVISDWDSIELSFYGDGPDLNKLREFTETRGNIKVHGRFEKHELKDIYSNTHLLWACYPTKNLNVKYATSNKAIESIYFSIPCVLSKGTMIGELFSSKKIGFTVNPYSKKDINEFLRELTLESLKGIENNLKESKSEKIVYNQLDLKVFKEI